MYVYRNGIPDWVKHGYPIESDVTYPDTGVGTITGEDLKAMLDDGERILVLDIRDRADFSMGRIGVSINIALDDIHERWEELPKDRKIVLVDRHGKQVNNSARYLAYMGLSDLAMLEKGFVDSWKVPGYPVAEGL